jgi:hypothetical protein
VPPASALSLTPETASYQKATDAVPSKPWPAISLPEITMPEITMPEVTLPDVEVDWAAVGLGLLALIAVGGLIPFWIYIYFLYNPR